MYREKELSRHSHKLAMFDNRHAIFHKSLQACVTETAYRDEVHFFLHAYGLSEAVHSKGSKISRSGLVLAGGEINFVVKFT